MICLHMFRYNETTASTVEPMSVVCQSSKTVLCGPYSIQYSLTVLKRIQNKAFAKVMVGMVSREAGYR